MASEAVVELTDQNFEEVVLGADKPVLVDFWADWCRPCKMLAPTIDQIGDEYVDKAVVAKLDTGDSREIAVKYEIMVIPTILIFKGGEVVKKFVGMTSKADLAAALDENM